MPLVGDVILSARETIPDMPQVMYAPIINSITQNANGTGIFGPDTLPRYFVATHLNAWGESIGSNEVNLLFTNTNASVTLAITISPAATFLRIYYGPPGAGGGEVVYFTVPLTPGSQGITVTVGTSLNTTIGSPPNRSSAYLPDTDGGMVNAFSLYRWLNEGLNILSKKAGGIQDASGVPTVNGQSMYTLPQKWIKLTTVWFDGWELFKGNRSTIFYRNSVVAISELTVTLKQADSSIIEIFPQPNRTSGSSLTTTAQILATDTQFHVNSTGSWVLPFGLAMLGGPPPAAFEIVSYASFSGNVFIGMVRGLGGTSPQTWPIGTTVRELNLRFEGYRMANAYAVGSSTQTLAIPDGWGDILNVFMNSKALDVQGDKTGAAKLRKEFMDSAVAIGSANRLLQGPVQIGGDLNGIEIYNPGAGGGFYLP